MRLHYFQIGYHRNHHHLNRWFELHLQGMHHPNLGYHLRRNPGNCLPVGIHRNYHRYRLRQYLQIHWHR